MCRQCRSGSNECTSSRREPRLARVQPNLEEPAQFLTRDPGEGQWASRLDLDEPHHPLAGAVATEVALLLAQRSQASHARSLCGPSDGTPTHALLVLQRSEHVQPSGPASGNHRGEDAHEDRCHDEVHELEPRHREDDALP